MKNWTEELTGRKKNGKIDVKGEGLNRRKKYGSNKVSLLKKVLMEGKN